MIWGTPSISDFTDVTEAMTSIGWTIIVSAGDDGAYADCSSLSVDYPASDPNAIAVGGTTLCLGGGDATICPGVFLGAQGSFRSERAWTGNGCNGQGVAANGGGGGGGCSDVFPAPPWNVIGQCPSQRRAIPDLSLNAGSTQVFRYLGTWQFDIHGTSVAAPELAGFFAQANSYLAFIGLTGNICGPFHTAPCGPIGQPGQALYAAATTAPQNPYYDVKDGSCNGGGPVTGDCTSPGYDKATGWGSANMLQLAWAINYFHNAPGTTPPVIAMQGPRLMLVQCRSAGVVHHRRCYHGGGRLYSAVGRRPGKPPLTRHAGQWRSILGRTARSIRDQRFARPGFGRSRSSHSVRPRLGQRWFWGRRPQHMGRSVSAVRQVARSASHARIPIYAPPNFALSQCASSVDFFQTNPGGANTLLQIIGPRIQVKPRFTTTIFAPAFPAPIIARDFQFSKTSRNGVPHHHRPLHQI